MPAHGGQQPQVERSEGRHQKTSKGGNRGTAAWPEPPCDDRFGLFTHKRCAFQALYASSIGTWP
jgi:hypothetical protein